MNQQRQRTGRALWVISGLALLHFATAGIVGVNHRSIVDIWDIRGQKNLVVIVS